MDESLYFRLLVIALCSVSECSQRRYHHINMTMNWTEAQRYCRENYTDLATVNNINDMNELMSKVNESDVNNNDLRVWIGLKNTGVYKWKWSMDHLILINETMSWSEALVYCRQHHVDLVSVVSDEIQRWVTEVIEHQNSTASVWMGLRHSCSVGIWFWVNGEPVCYQNWAPGNGTSVEDCDPKVRSGAVQRDGDHQWISHPDTDKLNFICIKHD
ncbi:P-selectin-like [Misgurnus anguillicaudatus]|uniref:P-selectin-like n=1 Tax=Misgurnus anguillicaudatus TaxID=75329 RepID=UPI003CCF8C18